MKENDGRAARRLRGRGCLALGLLVGVLALNLLRQSSTSSGSSSSSNNHALAVRRQDSRPLSAVRGTYYRPPSPEDIAADDDDPRHAALLRGEYTLVDLQVQHVHETDGTYTARGSFCQVDWKAHKEHPSLTPMFRDVRAQSPLCDKEHLYQVADLQAVVAAMQAYDVAHPQRVKVLELAGVVFQESRCGSTLVANLLQAADPVAHRVYAEAPPPFTALAEDRRYSAEQLVSLVQDVVYSMSRTTDPRESRVFFKIQSAGTRHLAVWQAAFSTVPWLFVFREPVQILMSHFRAGRESVRRANCARTFRQPPALVTQRLQREGRHTWRSQTHESFFESYCAASLSTFTETVLTNLNEHAFPVAYSDLPDILWTTLLPHVWGISLDEAALQRLQATGQEYSKGRGAAAGQVFQGDSQAKEAQAWPAVQEAAATFLQESFTQLLAVAEERKQQYE